MGTAESGGIDFFGAAQLYYVRHGISHTVGPSLGELAPRFSWRAGPTLIP